MGGGDTLLLGRTTYETFAASFAHDTTDNPMAAQMNAIRKVVVSNTLTSADWQNSTLVSGDAEAAVRALKQEDGKNINISGSPTLVNWLVQHGLLDELDLLLFPLVVGHGRRLFEGSGNQVGLQLTSSETFSTGVVHLNYRPATD
jgi:dihydrofolate reductase